MVGTSSGIMNPGPSTLLFDYDLFDPVPEGQWSGSDLKHAVELARVLAEHLSSEPLLVPEEPVAEDFGAVLDIRVPQGDTRLTISFYPRDNDFGWAVVVSQKRSLIQVLLRKRDDEAVVGPVKQALARLVGSRSEFRQPKWIDEGQM